MQSGARMGPGEWRSKSFKRCLHARRHARVRTRSLHRASAPSHPSLADSGGRRRDVVKARPPPRLAGIRAGGLTRFAFPPAFVRMIGQWHRKRMRGAAKTLRRRSLTVAGTAQIERGSAACFPFNCTRECMCGHQTRAYDSTREARAISAPGPRFLDARLRCGLNLHALLVLVCALMRMQSNGKQGARLQGRANLCCPRNGKRKVTSWRFAWRRGAGFECPRARPRGHITTGREITRSGRGSGAFASPDTGRNTKGERRGDAALRSCPHTRFLRFSCCSKAVVHATRRA